MTAETITLAIPFESLLEAVSALSLEEKRRLRAALDDEIAEAEEEEWEKDESVQAELREARAAYQIGDYVTLDKYAARRREPT